MLSIPIFEEDQIVAKIKAAQHPNFETYYAFYSSWFGGILKNPSLMLLPMDDHMVHRGDGVFEGIKSISRSIYLLDEHLQRLFISAKKIELESPFSFEEIKEIVIQTLLVADKSDVLIRIFLSRGPGSFSVNPYDSIKPQLYVIITQLVQPPKEKYEQGVKIGKSNILSKDSWMAQVKSCNYLPNVLMKKEAVDRQLDFVIGVDEKNYVTEGATENIIILDQKGTLVHPPLGNILKGVTMMRTCELAYENGIPTEERLISFDELKTAREVMITGTSINVLPVVRYEDHVIGTGEPGQIFTKLNQLIIHDINKGAKRTSF